MAEDEITIAEEDGRGERVSLPVVEVLTGRAFLTGKSGAGKSILEGTPVYTGDGRKPIERVEEGERVLSLNRHTYEQEFREVQATIEHTDDRLLRITLEDGTELVGTEDHSFLTAEGMEVVPVRGDEITEGTWMPLSRQLPSSGTVERIDLGEYVGEASNVYVDGGQVTSAGRTEDRFLDLDFPMGKVVGLYLAEGSFDSKETLQISNVDDDIHEFLGSWGFNVYERMCTVGFQPLARFLKSTFGSGSGGKSIPNWVFDAPEEFRAGVLSGYFDGNGTVGDSSVTAMSKSPALADGVKELLRQFGVSSTIRDKFTLYDGERRRYRRLTVDAFSVGTFAEVADLSAGEKSERLAALVEQLDDGESYNSKDMVPNFGPVLNAAARERDWTKRDSDKRVRGASVHHLTNKRKAGRETYNALVDELGIEGRARAYGESDIQWKRVVEVEELEGERLVYDLDVRGNDNFVANGVFVHNSNTASVVIERLLDQGFPVLVVDIDGEYYGLKEEYEILHAGADEECDIQVGPEHAERIAALALEQNVPIILDISSFLDESEARTLLTEVAKQLFAKEKKLKQPFLLVVEEVHEWIPEGGGLDECGRMLIKIGKRGRKHGLGIAGISQRPADVKKDFITQCDWLVWHRLTWQNDTQVVRRVLDADYAEAVEDLDDGEGFLMTDWAEDVRRVQFDRKETFDAGATPGLDDFERPELKSVSSDLVSELEQISEKEAQREDEIERLRSRLQAREERIRELEEELAEARDLSRMADQFAEAMLERAGDGFERTTLEEAAERGAAAVAERTNGDGRTDTADASGEGSASAEANGSAGTEPDPTPSAEEQTSTEPDPAPDTDATESGTSRKTATEPTDATSTDESRWPTDDGRDGRQRPIVRRLRAELSELSDTERGMLAHYRDHGPAEPGDAHVAAGGPGDETRAYARNRALRSAGLVRHAGRGLYDYALREAVVDEYGDRLDGTEIDDLVRQIEDGLLPAPGTAWPKTYSSD